MRRFGLIGSSLKHSFSKNYFTKKFIEEGIDGCVYDLFELGTIEQLEGLITATPCLEGLNVTIPFKESVIPFLHRKDELVQKIGACNCIRLIDGKLYGFNTDAGAFKKSLQLHLKPHHACALILGSGGASKAVQASLKDLQIDFLVVSRTKKGSEIGYEEVGEDVVSNHQLIINTTPLGMYPNMENDPPIPYGTISSKHLLFDLIYNPEKTKFLQQGESRGALLVNGLEMLRFQAEESWKIWNEIS